MAQLEEHLGDIEKVAGSNPAWGTGTRLAVHQPWVVTESCAYCWAQMWGEASTPTWMDSVESVARCYC